MEQYLLPLMLRVVNKHNVMGHDKAVLNQLTNGKVLTSFDHVEWSQPHVGQP